MKDKLIRLLRRVEKKIDNDEQYHKQVHTSIVNLYTGMCVITSSYVQHTTYTVGQKSKPLDYWQ